MRFSSLVLIFSATLASQIGESSKVHAAGTRAAPRAGAKIKKVQSTSPTLNESDRSSLRYRLENIWNEVDLMVRNANADKKDIQRQEREFKMLQVFQKFPIATPEAGKFSMVSDEIRKSAQRFGLTLTGSKLIQSNKPDRPVPATMPPDVQEFKFTEDQLVQKTRMDLTLTGTKRQLQDWMNSWATVFEPGETNNTPTPYLEWDPQALTTLPEALSDSVWKVHVQAYLFRDIQYPKLQPKNPLQILPDWAKKNPDQFKAQEPLLWSLVERTQATIPKALPGYELRARFAMNAARMTFFTSKVTHFD